MVAQGTGQALETAKRGDADVVFVHARAAEDAFVAEGWGVERFEVMYNDFVIVGPAGDPAGIKAAADAPAALAAIAAAEAAFASRGDDSGTHQAEKALWEKAGVAPSGDWYRETGSGMGATLNTAAELQAYALTDRGTWISFQNKGDLDDPVRRRPRALQPLRRDPGEPREAPAREGRGRPALHRLADLARRARPRSPATRSTASSCSSRTPRACPAPAPTADVSLAARCATPAPSGGWDRQFSLRERTGPGRPRPRVANRLSGRVWVSSWGKARRPSPCPWPCFPPARRGALLVRRSPRAPFGPWRARRRTPRG